MMTSGSAHAHRRRWPYATTATRLCDIDRVESEICSQERYSLTKLISIKLYKPSQRNDSLSAQGLRTWLRYGLRDSFDVR
jgi:hypothetical protein